VIFLILLFSRLGLFVEQLVIGSLSWKSFVPFVRFPEPAPEVSQRFFLSPPLRFSAGFFLLSFLRPHFDQRLPSNVNLADTVLEAPFLPRAPRR